MVVKRLDQSDMADIPHHIRLVAGIELRPPGPGARFEFTRDESERLGALAAEDLARVVPDVTAGHLVTGAALLEPGQTVNPETAPWQAMARLADLGQGLDPGVTSLGVHRGQPPSDTLVPYRSPPQGLFLCLPLLLAMTPARADQARSKLEATLFESGGLHPPFMAALADIPGLEPVHGQLMTNADLTALLKVQLAGAGLDPFWPPVEHAMEEIDLYTRILALATHPGQPRVFWASNGYGLWRSEDAGESWRELPLEWPEGFVPSGCQQLVVVTD